MQEVDAGGGCSGWVQGLDAGGGCRRRMQEEDAGGGCRRRMQEEERRAEARYKSRTFTRGEENYYFLIPIDLFASIDGRCSKSCRPVQHRLEHSVQLLIRHCPSAAAARRRHSVSVDFWDALRHCDLLRVAHCELVRAVERHSHAALLTMSLYGLYSVYPHRVDVESHWR